MPTTPPALPALTRAALHDGSLLAAFRAHAPPDAGLLSDAELAASLDGMLADHDPAEDLWLFGYGSLMWNPAFEYVDAQPATVHGWSRRFCLWLYMARGSCEAPGLMLALDRGGACRGLALRIAASAVRGELALVWQREMIGGVYAARWVQAHIDGVPRRALTFVANRAHARYAGALPPERTAHFIATGTGRLGTCRAYFDTLLGRLAELGIRDAAMERLRLSLSNP